MANSIVIRSVSSRVWDIIGGETINITVENASLSGNTVYVGNNGCTVITENSTLITITTPAVSAGTYNLTVYTNALSSDTLTSYISVENKTSGNYFDYTDIPNQYITKCGTSNYAGSVGSYNNERELFDVLVTEAYNKHGVCMEYYITTFDKNYDRIFGEDNDKRFTRFFKVMGSFKLPREEKLWTKFGIEGMDQFSMYISKRHFWEASQYDSTQTVKNAAPYVPKAGDYIVSKYNKYAYEVVEVKDEEMMYLHSKQHIWELLVKPFKDEHIVTTSLTSASDMADISNQNDDKFNISNVIDQKKGDINYTPKGTEITKQDYFGNW
jgi:hypothetical protein